MRLETYNRVLEHLRRALEPKHLFLTTHAMIARCFHAFENKDVYRGGRTLASVRVPGKGAGLPEDVQQVVDVFREE